MKLSGTIPSNTSIFMTRQIPETPVKNLNRYNVITEILHVTSRELAVLLVPQFARIISPKWFELNAYSLRASDEAYLDSYLYVKNDLPRSYRVMTIGRGRIHLFISKVYLQRGKYNEFLTNVQIRFLPI